MSFLQAIFGDGHLPMTPLDEKNQPPLWFLQVEDVMNVSLGVAWTLAYILIARQGLKDKSYGIPLLTLWMNFGWDFTFGIWKADVTGMGLGVGPWVVIQGPIIYAAIKYGSVEWKHNRVVSDNLWWALPLSLPVSIAFYSTMVDSFERFQDVLLVTFIFNQLLTSLGAIAHLVEKGNTRGHTLAIWFCRALGSFLTTALVVFQSHHYPEDHRGMALPVTWYTMFVFEVADIIYPFVYMYYKREEQRKVESTKLKTKAAEKVGRSDLDDK